MAAPADEHAEDLALQRQARALGDPTRYAIFRYVAAADRPVTVAELTEHLGLNHNAIRQHLTKLCAAGLFVDRVTTRAGRGRPAVGYRLTPAGMRWLSRSTPYEQLSVLLLEMLRSGRPPRAVGYEAGRQVSLTEADGGDDAARLEHELDRRGFRPKRVNRRSSVEFVLQACPFASAALSDPAVVCELHRGLADGLAEAAGGGLEVMALVAKDPARAGCRLQLRPVST